MKARGRLLLSTVLSTAMLVLAGVLAGCDRAPSADGLPEWKASDHDRLANEQADRDSRQQAPQTAPTTAAPARADAGSRDAGTGMSTAELADLAWQSQCAACHGPTGHGDGPQSPMMHPPDFGSKEFQANHTDAELAASIANGKGKMPKFGLPDRVIAALVARVRSVAP